MRSQIDLVVGNRNAKASAKLTRAMPTGREDEFNSHVLQQRPPPHRHGVTGTYVTRVIRLNFLVPKIAESILAGNQPAALDAKRLLALRDLALAWPDQESALQI